MPPYLFVDRGRNLDALAEEIKQRSMTVALKYAGNSTLFKCTFEEIRLEWFVEFHNLWRAVRLSPDPPLFPTVESYRDSCYHVYRSI